ncbi:hypothetical protein C4D60_Mb06t26680 [Musa balbisiana]|uniref:Uncharacterized protein n=1 Tax=Musa balbisiana TaxID=52838 RepID=A0A4S8IQV3_MUSBA|nr:hypothetical protein C4D60_Mb06t26680 [Musa balbisiana]
MPSDASLADLEVNTSRRWFRLIMSLSSGQSAPFLGILETGNQYLSSPEALKTLVRPMGEVFSMLRSGAELCLQAVKGFGMVGK